MVIKESIPNPADLIESLRDFGYSLETALSDLIDNSITAHAKNVWISADLVNGDAEVRILDDGVGMDTDTLENAMKLGSQNPLHDRDSKDLGRFGLGLKTASFSQCRRVTVVSVRNGQRCGARWDLDLIQQTGAWSLEILEDFSDVPWSDRLEKSGTLVVWQKSDRIVEAQDGLAAEKVLAAKVARATDHLSLVFHRFLDSKTRGRNIRIHLDSVLLEPHDPFYADHRDTVRVPSKPEVFPYHNHSVRIQGFTLPHYSRLTKEDWEHNQGTAGYLRSQGFYLYREQRLIIWGTWFGLARASELTKLARVRLDITNDQDAEWKIDVRKASAQPPQPVRARLRELIGALTGQSTTRTKRAPRALSTQFRYAPWQRTIEGGRFRYSVDSRHPLLVDFSQSLDDTQRDAFVELLRFLSASLPLETILGDMSSAPKDSAQTEIEEPSLLRLVDLMANSLMAQGETLDHVKEILQSIEPFKTNWPVVEGILVDFWKRARDG